MGDPVVHTRPGARRRRHARIHWLSVVALTVVWLLLWGRVSPNLVLLGVVVSIVIAKAFPLPSLPGFAAVRPVPTLRLAARFALDLVVASVQVAGHALGSGPRTRSAVVAVELRTRSELLMTLTGEILSLVPGTLIVELRRSTGTLYLHVLGATGPEDVRRARTDVLALEARVLRAFGDDDAVRALEAER